MRKLWIVSGAVLAAIIAVLVILPFVVDADRFRPQVESQLQTVLGRKVSIGKLRLSIWHRGVTASEALIAEDPAFGQSPFLKATSISIGVEVIPLIFSKSLIVDSIVIEEPEVRLVHAANGRWNYSTIGASTTVRSLNPEGAKRGHHPKTAQQ